MADQPRHPAGVTEGGQFRDAQPVAAAAIMTEADQRAQDRMDEFAGHPGTGIPLTDTAAVDGMNRWGAPRAASRDEQ